MRRKPEILILAGLLVGAMAFVLWYVIERRAKLRTSPPAVLVGNTPMSPAPSAPTSPGPIPTAVGPTTVAPVAADAPKSNEPVDLGKHDGQTVDFSGGQPVVKNSAEDKAAIDAALKDIQSAEKEVTFESPKKHPPPGK